MKGQKRRSRLSSAAPNTVPADRHQRPRQEEREQGWRSWASCTGSDPKEQVGGGGAGAGASSSTRAPAEDAGVLSGKKQRRRGPGMVKLASLRLPFRRSSSVLDGSSANQNGAYVGKFTQMLRSLGARRVSGKHAGHTS